ncbi:MULTISPECIES: hypothetical protein [Actinokineospora]|uniref:hypothetical protein n=1 Tax=Actinokineospora TaxID=39845 RepID=UPI0016709B0E|nr:MULTISPECIES: hypothetical protein [Actinokineospora]
MGRSAISAQQHGEQAGQDENDVGVHGGPLLSRQWTAPIDLGSTGSSVAVAAVAWYPVSSPAAKPASSIQNPSRTANENENKTFTATPVDWSIQFAASPLWR